MAITSFNNFPSTETAHVGSDSDLQREKRLNSWLRSYTLPSMLGNTVQNAMLSNPYDRSASLRMDLAQDSVNSTNLPWRTREALANELFRAQTIDPFNATSSSGPSSLTRSPQKATSTPAPGPVAVAGNINGRDVMVPTAGNYMNHAYQNQMQGLGLSESPTVDAYRAAFSNYKTPEQRQAEAAERLRYDRAVDVAKINAQGRVDAVAAKPIKTSGKDATIEAYRKQLGVDDRERSAKVRELHAAYERYIRALPDQTKAEPFDKWSMDDLVARDIASKYQALGESSGRLLREGQTNRENLRRGNMTVGARAEELTQRMFGEKNIGSGAAVQSEVQSKVSSAIQQAKANGATDEQILAAAQQSGLSGAELSAVQAELEGKAIRKAQYGAPAKPPMSSGKASKSDVVYGPRRSQSPRARGPYGAATMDAQGRAHDTASWGVPQGTATPNGYDSSVLDYSQRPASPSFLDELLRRLPSTPNFNPLMPGRPSRYGVASPIA